MGKRREKRILVLFARNIKLTGKTVNAALRDIS